MLSVELLFAAWCEMKLSNNQATSIQLVRANNAVGESENVELWLNITMLVVKHHTHVMMMNIDISSFF